MLPVSGAEQLNTSGAMVRAAHDLAQRRVFQIREPGAVLALRQEQIPQARRARLGLQLFDDSGGLPAVIRIEFVRVALFVRINVLVHEGLQPFLERFDFVGKFEIHKTPWVSSGKRCLQPTARKHRRALLQEMRHAFLEVLALQALHHLFFGGLKCLA